VNNFSGIKALSRKSSFDEKVDLRDQFAEKLPCSGEFAEAR
jgi:hypothetical protein